MKKKVLPSIHISLQDQSGSVAWVWYMYFSWLVDNIEKNAEDIAALDEELDTKVDKTDQAERLYGTDENGDQTTYDIDSLIPDVNLDNVTIDKNSSDQLQAIGTKNKNTASGATANIYDWVGTLAEYNAQNIATLHPEWLCFITDDINPDTTYTKAEADALFVRKTGNYYENVTGTKNFLAPLRVKYGTVTPSTNTVKESVIETHFLECPSNTSGKIDGPNIVRAELTTGDREVWFRAGFRKADDSGNLWPAVRVGVRQNGRTFIATNVESPDVSNNGPELVQTSHLINVLKTIWPVGAIFITEANSCPLASLFGTWTLQSNATDRALWGGNGGNGGGTIAAGAPNISGTVIFETLGDRMTNFGATGAFTFDRQTGVANDSWDHGGNYGIRNTIGISATRSSSVYGNSSTIQPAAYRVNVWKRTA